VNVPKEWQVVIITIISSIFSLNVLSEMFRIEVTPAYHPLILFLYVAGVSLATFAIVSTMMGFKDELTRMELAKYLLVIMAGLFLIQQFFPTVIGVSNIIIQPVKQAIIPLDFTFITPVQGGL